MHVPGIINRVGSRCMDVFYTHMNSSYPGSFMLRSGTVYHDVRGGINHIEPAGGIGIWYNTYIGSRRRTFIGQEYCYSMKIIQ